MKLIDLGISNLFMLVRLNRAGFSFLLWFLLLKDFLIGGG